MSLSIRAYTALAVALWFAGVADGRSESIRLADQRGELIRTTPPAERVVTFNSVLWLYLTLEGSARPIVGASSGMLRIVTGGLLGEVFPDAAGIANTVATDGFFVPNVEAILALRPDAVFQWSGRNDPAYLAPLERVGLPAIGLRQNNSDEDYFATARLVGAIAGRQARVERLIARYQTLYAELGRDVAAASAGRHRERVLYLWRTKPLIPIDGANFYGTLLERSGGINAARDLKRPGVVNMERILAWNPEVVLLYCCDRTRPDDLYADPAWQPVAAVKARRVYKIPAGGSRFGDIVEGPLFSRWLTELLFPDLPPRLRADVKETFRDVYGATLTDAIIDDTLRISDNAASAHYQRFRHD